MKIWIRCDDIDQEGGGRFIRMALALVDQLIELGFDAALGPNAPPGRTRDGVCIAIGFADSTAATDPYRVAIGPSEVVLEQVLRALPLAFNRLPLLTEGESKVVRSWTDRVVVSRFKPTVYSYTANRYGEVPGTEQCRLKFAAALFRRMATLEPIDGVRPQSAFLAEVEDDSGQLLVERRVETCNVETRIKRYHVGSPIHRYRYTERYSSTQRCGPISQWSRLDEPVVCFDWRHPLLDNEGNRLADEPLSDDYARVWMYDVDHAKVMARQTFLWMERMFAAADVCLVDMCILIDRWGKTIYGEISQDCMRVRLDLGDPSSTEAMAKDVWRVGGPPEVLRRHYDEIHRRLFESSGDRAEMRGAALVV